MKTCKILLSVVLAMVGFVAMAQDLSVFADPRYAKWGETPEERRDNMMRSTFLKEAIQNKLYNEAAAHYVYLTEHAPAAAEAIYQRGEQLYLRKMALATSSAEQREKFDSMLMVYDLRVRYFGTDPLSKAEILDRRARQYALYGKRDREGLREAFRMAIDADAEGKNPVLYETIVLYFGNLIEDYKNDEVYPDEVIAEYDRLSPYFENAPADKTEFQDQFDTLFGTSGVASCENLEALFREKLAGDPNNLDVLNQAVALMGRAKCSSDFFFEITERQYTLAPSANTAIFLAQGFQEKGNLEKAVNYLREALNVETDVQSRENLLQQLGIVELAANHIGAAVEAARQLREMNPNSGYSYFILAQCYAASGCTEAYWAAYDTMKKAEELFQEANLKQMATTLAAAYAARWPQANDERFFMEGIKAGDSVTIPCGAASGIRTTARFR